MLANAQATPWLMLRSGREGAATCRPYFSLARDASRAYVCHELGATPAKRWKEHVMVDSTYSLPVLNIVKPASLSVDQ